MKKQALFDRHPAGHSTHSAAFSGHGFLPDLFSSGRHANLPASNATTLENGFIVGRDGMMPVGGYTGQAQRGQRTDTGAGGAGSFATRAAFGAKG